MSIELLTRGYLTTVKKIFEQVPLGPAEAQDLLVRALELPLPPELTTEALGIHQSDVIIRTAVVAAIADMRANPWLLDYVFASLAQDAQTLKDYGEKEIQRAKDWFLKTNIRVVMVPVVDEAKVPVITIKLLSSDESEVTLGDVHYDPTETNLTPWPALAGPFNITKYNAATGIMVLPTEVTDNIIVAPGMVLVDTVGNPHSILEVFDDGSLTIEQGTVADFSKTLLKGAQPNSVTQLESAWYRESYQIGCHVSGEPVYLTWLHSIIVFILLRYKQALLEARGFERSVVNSSDFDRNESEFPDSEFVYSRYITITGNVRQYWPKSINPAVTAVVTQPIRVIDAKNLPPDTDPNTQIWVGDEDTLKPPK